MSVHKATFGKDFTCTADAYNYSISVVGFVSTKNLCFPHYVWFFFETIDIETMKFTPVPVSEL